MFKFSVPVIGFDECRLGERLWKRVLAKDVTDRMSKGFVGDKGVIKFYCGKRMSHKFLFSDEWIEKYEEEFVCQSKLGSGAELSHGQMQGKSDD